MGANAAGGRRPARPGRCGPADQAAAQLNLTSLGFDTAEHFYLWWTALRSELGFPVVLDTCETPGWATATLRAGTGTAWSAEAHSGPDHRLIALRIGPTERPRQPAVQVIQLNGISSSGKTSIARTLQVVLPGIWLHFQPDELALMLPRRPTTATEWRLFDQGVLASAQALLNKGNRLIIDHVLVDSDQATTWQQGLSSFHVLRVGLHCASSVAQARERRRGDRRPGLNAAQAPLGEAALTYDLRIDTTSLTPLAAARMIKTHLLHGPAGRDFRTGAAHQ